MDHHRAMKHKDEHAAASSAAVKQEKTVDSSGKDPEKASVSRNANRIWTPV